MIISDIELYSKINTISNQSQDLISNMNLIIYVHVYIYMYN